MESGYVVNVEGAVVRDGEYLLIERGADEDHAAGMLAFPGGKVEQSPGGTRPIEATVRRELDEELGIGVGSVTYVTSWTFEADTGNHVINVVTQCEDRGDTPTIRSRSEVGAIHWVSPGDIDDYPDAPAFLEECIEAVEAVRNDTS